MFAMYNLDDLILPFGVDITVPGADGVFRVTTPIQSEFEDPSGVHYISLIFAKPISKQY